MVDKKDVLLHWYYFCSLSSQFGSTEQYVDHEWNDLNEFINGKTYSSEFNKILMLASSEFEVVAKKICEASNIPVSDKANIVEITKNVLSKYPNIGRTVLITNQGKSMPLKDWRLMNSTGKMHVEGISWWQKHNDVKHARTDNYKEANLQNCFDALSSLMVLELYLARIVLGNPDDLPRSSDMYFYCECFSAVRVTAGGMKLPDF